MRSSTLPQEEKETLDAEISDATEMALLVTTKAGNNLIKLGGIERLVGQLGSAIRSNKLVIEWRGHF